MNSGVEDFGFGLVVFFLVFTFKLIFFNGNTLFKVNYLPLPNTPVCKGFAEA